MFTVMEEVDPSMDIVCFICNMDYVTTVVRPNAVSLSSKARIITLCNLFGLTDDKEQQLMLRLAFLSEPFCLTCSEKLNRLQDWIHRLERLETAIKDMKVDIGGLIAHSFPNSPNIEGTYSIKGRIAEEVISIMNTNTLEIQLFGQVVEDQTASHSNYENQSTEKTDDVYEYEVFTTGENDEVDYVNEVEIEAQEIPIPLPLPKPKPKTRNQHRKSSVPKKSKRHRDPTPIRQQPIRKIDAHPDGRCRLCPSTFRSQIQLAKHIRRAHSGITHPCRYCNKTFHDTSNRKRHELSMHIAQSKDFVCETCGKGYKTQSLLREHTKVVHEGYVKKDSLKIPSQCHVCGKICNTPKYLKIHTQLKHMPPKQIPCSICGRLFKNMPAKKQHERTHMSITERLKLEGKTFFYKCSICPIEGQMGFSSKGGLQVHYATQHAEEEKCKLIVPSTKPIRDPRKYFCPECPFAPGFTRKLTLQVHIANGHRRLVGKIGKNCKICGKPCRDTTKAKKHEDTHHPRAHLCPICFDIASRKRLIRRHYGECHPHDEIPEFKTLLNFREKKHFCPECPEHPGFTQRTGLKLHIAGGHFSIAKRKRGSTNKIEGNSEIIVKESDSEESEEDEDENHGFFKEDSDSDEVEIKSKIRKIRKKIKDPLFMRRGGKVKRKPPGNTLLRHRLPQLKKDVRIHLKRIDSLPVVVKQLIKVEPDWW